MKVSAAAIRICALVLISTASFAQEYPRWFLDQGDLPCAGGSVGITATPYYPDSTGGQGLMLAAENAVRYRAVTFSGSKAYFTSEEGTAVVGTSVIESFDTSRVEKIAKAMKLLALYTNRGLQIVLAGSTECDVPRSFSELVRVDRPFVPAWMTAMPRDETMAYALGVSDSFYYEQSSWIEAEKNARLELARMAHSKLRGVEHLDRDDAGMNSGSGVRDEDLGSTTLRGIRVLHRWRNPSTNLFYVLLGMPR